MYKIILLRARMKSEILLNFIGLSNSQKGLEIIKLEFEEARIKSAEEKAIRSVNDKTGEETATTDDERVQVNSIYWFGTFSKSFSM